MVFIVLYLVGGLLFVNGLFLFGIITNLPGVVVYNFLGGILITIMAIYIAAKDLYAGFGETVSSVVCATCLTFSIAYLLIGLEGLTLVMGLKMGANFSVLGWYCLPMSICVFCLSLGWYQVIGTKMPKVPQFGLLWLIWSICFFLFFLVFGAGVAKVQPLTGIFILIVGIITCSYPALANFQAGKVGQW